MDNPLYPLYVKQFSRGFSVHRLADDARIATVAVRDMSEVAGYQWDPTMGKFMSVFYKDGTVRIYDGFRSGKLVSFLRVGEAPVQAGIWDRIELAQDAAVIDQDVTQRMPRMIKFARDSNQLCVVPYNLASDVWTVKGVLDVHVLLGKSWMVMLDGELPLCIAMADTQVQLVKLVAVQHTYFAFHSDGIVQTLDITPLLHPPTLRLLATVVTMRQLQRYLVDHSDLISRDLIQPYEEFVERTCEGAFGYAPLQEELTQLLLSGSISPELEDWLVNSIAEKNLRRWRKLGTDSYHKALQVLTLAFVPACERLIALSQRQRGIMAAQDIPPLSPKPLQDLFHAVLEAIAHLSSQQQLLGSFLDWLDDRARECIDEDYKPHHKVQSATPNIAKYLQLRLQSSSPEFESVDLADLLKTSENHLREISTVLQKELLSKIETHTQSLAPPPDEPPLDVIVFNKRILLVSASQATLLDSSLRILSQHTLPHVATSARWRNSTLHATLQDGSEVTTSYQVTPNDELLIASTASRAMRRSE